MAPSYLDESSTRVCMVCISRFKEVITKSKDSLVALGFPTFTIEDFHSVVCVVHMYVYTVICLTNI